MQLFNETKIDLMQGDCVELMKKIPDNSIDLILTDPPYGTIKGIEKHHKGIKRTDWDNPIDLDVMFEFCERVLRKNGTCILFSQEPFTSKLIYEAKASLPFSCRFVWRKENFANYLGIENQPVNYTEDICVFYKPNPKHDYEGHHPLRAYAEIVKKWIGKSSKEIFNDLGNQSVDHFFRVNSSQFSLCTKESYYQLVDKYGVDKMNGYKCYGDLKIVDDQYRVDLINKMNSENPRIFNIPRGDKFVSNLLEFRRDSFKIHPTQKPVGLLSYLMGVYSNEFDTVLDFTMGSGSTVVAAKNSGRHCIGIEQDDEFYWIAEQRIFKNRSCSDIGQELRKKAEKTCV